MIEATTGRPEITPYSLHAVFYVLNLHGIGTAKHEVPPSEARVWISQEQFAAALDFTKGRTDVAWTFDDANESDYTVALPALQSRGLKAQFFIVADRVDRPGYLSSHQIEELIGAGMEIGSHGLRHRPWAELANGELEEELLLSRERLQELACQEIRNASCPYGSYNRRVIGALQRAGYKRVYTSDQGPARRGSYLVPRNTIYRTWNGADLRTATSKPGTASSLCRSLKLLLKRLR